MYKITEIESLFPNWYDPKHPLSRDDQAWIWENVPLPHEDNKKLRELSVYENVLNGLSENGGYKNNVNFGLNWNKPEVILRLKNCTVKTPPNEVALLLSELFSPWPSKEGHWLWIAQRFTPKVINWQVAATTKEYLRGAIRSTPAAYFTYEIRFRKKQKPKHQKEVETEI